MHSSVWQTALVLAVGISLGTSASSTSAPRWSGSVWMHPARTVSGGAATSESPELVAAGLGAQQREGQAKLVAELRRTSGLTWEQLARVFGVSRRTLHFWASGKPMLPIHEERVARVLAVVRRVDRGSAASTRRTLMTITSANELPFDLLVAGRYSELEERLGIGKPRRTRTLAPLSATEREARRPVHPSVAANALQLRVQGMPAKDTPDKMRG